MSNKVLKHGFVKEMESIFEEEGRKIKHSEMAQKLEEIMEDPSKIGVKVPPDTIEACYFPIVQSGGSKAGYNIKPSASSDDETMTEDVIIVSLGARFKNYCSNVSRTYVIDSVPKVQATYEALVKLQAECLSCMVPGAKLVEVYEKARAFLDSRHRHLLPHLPKSLGFSLGLDFKDSVYTLTSKTDAALKFKPNMVFCLSVGFDNVELTAADRSRAKGSVKTLNKFSMLIGDTVKISGVGPAEVLTKAPTEWSEVSYTLNEQDENEGDEDDDGSQEEDEAGAEEGIQVKTVAGKATILPDRFRRRPQATDEVFEAKRKRAEKQQQLHDRARERGLAKGGSAAGAGDDKAAEATAEDFAAYSSSEQYPPEVRGSGIHVDMDKEAVFLPIGGEPVPFHISTIKSVAMPDADRSTYLRINFYIPGQAVAKDTPPQMAAILNKHRGETDQVFIKEFTYRSASATGLQGAFRLIQELRKRSKARAVKEGQEADLVVQPKLMKLKDQKVPRLADIEMRPALTGRKSKGTLDAHANGLRFTSGKTGEHIDIMYANIKHAIFQPCHAEHIVLIHFHLTNPIMIGKKKTVDVQFITEVVEASEDVGARGSVYDPDEIEVEQRERKMRKMLNMKFKDYTQKVEEVAKKNDFALEFDVPFKDLAFQGTPNREMVKMQPTVHCLVNLTELPHFVVCMNEVEHVHFERCTVGSKNFDMVFIMKNHSVAPRMVGAIDTKDLDDIQEWLTQQEITFTMGTINLAWKPMMATVADMIEGGVFWDDVDEDGGAKDPGWLFLNAEGGEDEEDEDDEDEEEYKGGSDEEEESDDDDDDDDEDESFEDEDEDDDDFDEEEEEEADGQDWEELEREARISDKKREAAEDEEAKKGSKPVKASKKGGR